MEFFLDTASLEDIKLYKTLGLVDGVTTNPALLAKEGQDPLEQVRKIASMVSGPISVEVTYTESDKMVKHAIRISKLADNVVIKIPASTAGLAAACVLKEKGIKLNVTLIFHPSQAIPFIKLGADYVSLFVGRVEDFGLSNKDAIGQIRESIDMMQSPTKLLAASIRNPEYLLEAVNAGSDALTVPPSCWEKVYNNPIFQLGEKEFLESWNQLPAALRKNYETY
ncbi:MAG: fructose-6-phosphate aldolase [Nitrospirae bacterium]|nr:fructose-6-phosphate aldolase [Nitrospirota bacterium]